MASLTRTPTKEPASDSPTLLISQESTGPDAQSYLISKYREALKKGDKSDAKSCLLAARYFSVNDPNVTNEIYMMAKSDGDVKEASKCFAKIFTNLFIAPEQSSLKPNSNELSTVVNQTKEEIRVLLNELKSYFLKLKSQPAPAAIASRQLPSINPSPILSPRIRMSSEDRTTNRDTVSKLDTHLHTSTRSFFYQQLFENLPEPIKKSILDHSIETCDNPFESCRLMMLALSIFNDSVTNYGSRLLRTLINLSDPNKKPEENTQPYSNPRSSIMCHYAKNLLVLDAIPLVLSINPLASLEIEVEELFERILNFYSDQCLETSATEYEPNELHEGVKKSIAIRILGIEHNSALEEAIEDQLISTLSLLSRKFIEPMPNSSTKTKLEKLRRIVSGRGDEEQNSDKLIELIHELNLEDVGLDDSKDDSNSQATATPPVKSRGRPKKTQQAVQDDTSKKSSSNKTKEVQFVFYSVVQHMFVNCAIYLKRTRSRVLLNFDNPLAALIESELTKTSSQRSSRSKTGSQQSSDIEKTPTKKIKLDPQHKRLNLNQNPDSHKTPLNSEQSKMVDIRILTTLIETTKCLTFLHDAFKRLWLKFAESNKILHLNWYRRFYIDANILSSNYDAALALSLGLLNNNERNQEQKDDPAETQALVPSLPVSNVTALRSLVQQLSCNIQLIDRSLVFENINDLLVKMKQSELLNHDESYSSGNIIEEYKVVVQHDDQKELGFLFFDSLSLVRYMVDILMDIMKRYSTNNGPITDIAIGHTIVLSQFDWPKEALIYDRCVSWLRQQKPKSTTQSLSASTKFTYTEFFQYIRNPNIIEDFMALLSQGYTLDIKSTSNAPTLSSASHGRGLSSSQGSSSGRNASGGSTSRSGKAITTRGVNKSYKEDLKVALIGQMKSSSFFMTLEMLSDFIQTNLIPFLTSTKK